MFAMQSVESRYPDCGGWQTDDDDRPFAYIRQTGGWGGNMCAAVNFYMGSGNRGKPIIFAHTGATNEGLRPWVDSDECPALHKLVGMLERATTSPPPQSLNEDRVVCTADCSYYSFGYDSPSDPDSRPHEGGGDHVGMMFLEARKAIDACRHSAG